MTTLGAVEIGGGDLEQERGGAQVCKFFVQLFVVE